MNIAIFEFVATLICLERNYYLVKFIDIQVFLSFVIS